MKAMSGLTAAVSLLLSLQTPAVAEERRPACASTLDMWKAGPAAAVDEVVRAEMERQHIPGLALAVLCDGQVVIARGYGKANLETGSDVSIDTAFNIGSLSKQFLATAVLILAQDGRLSLDEPVSAYLADAPESWRAMTLRHLLNHTSGLAREAPAFRPDQVQPDIDVIRSAYALPLLFPTGTRFEYSNLGYYVVAEIISRQSGEPWPDFVKTRIFDVAGMTASRPTSPTDLIPGRSGAYEWQAGRTVNVPPLAALRPSGAFVSSLSDLMRWDRVLDSDALISADFRRQMWTAPVLPGEGPGAYGFGWRLEPVEGHFEIGHGGALAGFRSYYARYPDDRLSVIVLTNEGDADPRAIVRAVARLVLND